MYASAAEKKGYLKTTIKSPRQMRNIKNLKKKLYAGKGVKEPMADLVSEMKFG